MTDHLPECLVPDFDKGLWICICKQLRACEERVLNAAREAVVALPYDEPEDDPQSREHEVEVRQRYLTAIDALREKS